MKIKELIEQGTQILKNNHIEDCNIKARILLQHILQKNKQDLLIYNNEEVVQEREKIYLQYIQQLIEGKPLQYITNRQEFMGLEFYVDENVLIPQPDTEILVEEAITVIKEKVKQNLEIENNQKKQLKNLTNNQKDKKTIRILDLCTGSGAIAISIARYLKENNEVKSRKNNDIEFEIYATDISKKALEIAMKNANKNGVEVIFFISDMFQEFEKKNLESFDIIASNPPYIETKIIETLSKEVQNEPHIALDGGQDGLDFYKTIAKDAIKYLKPNRNNTIRNRI